MAPSYDGNGSLTSDGTFTFGYDSENRLISASGAGNTASYTFDAQGRRKTRTVNGTTIVFVTDAANREVLEYDGASGAVLRWYAYGLGPNDVLGQMNVAAATRATLVPDMLGSVIGTLDSGSGVLSKIGYLPYGKSGSLGPFGYTGQRIDAETSGLYYYRARHYSPAWGRFVQTDPIGARGGANFYAYVGNDPLNFNDPNGLLKDGIVEEANNFYNQSILKPLADVQKFKLDDIPSILNSFPATKMESEAIALGVSAIKGIESIFAKPLTGEALLLQKSLASEAQSSQLLSGGGSSIAGAGTTAILRDEPRLIAQFGGNAGEWQKVTAGAFKAADGAIVETHAYRNIATGQTVELKSKIGN